ncbi:unnamed protein product [Pedinophyceae sp. YPF-701]|nr:unnamed protein product [Pedinophyceae sp. YPF-701]
MAQAKLTTPGGKTISLPYHRDNAGNEFVDISKLQPSTGICTYDTGFSSTAACTSTITFIDGEKGILLYRGYDIAEVASKGDFIDAVALLVAGELPDREARARLRSSLATQALVPEALVSCLGSFDRTAHPMAILVALTGALAAFYPEYIDVSNAALREEACVSAIAKAPVLAAMAYKHSRSEPIVYPDPAHSYAEGLLYMLHSLPGRPYRVDPVLSSALEAIIVLHMDHEQNCSTSAVRVAGSSQTHPFAALAAGVAALWGPSHGGANEAVLRMLEQIGRTERIPQFVSRAKDKNDPFRLMGFGHRVYKTYDPRAKILRGVCHEVLGHLELDDPLLNVAMELEKVATTDPYFRDRGLYPNVDFYSGIVLRALGIPVTMYTALFAVSRTSGWMAQWKEMASESPAMKIARPRQMYMGAMRRPYVPLATRDAGSGSRAAPMSRL